MKEIWKRLTSESPKFFQRIQTLAITLGSIGGAVLLLPATGVVIPAALLTVATHCVSIGAVSAVIAKFTVQDSNVLKTDEKKPYVPQIQSTVTPTKP